MIKFVLADLESDGFLNEATLVWCGVFIDRMTKKRHVFLQHQIKEMLEFMDSCTHICFHNGTGFDFPLLKKLYDYEYHGIKIDTLVMSRYQSTKRSLPMNAPPEIKNKPHSIEAWGWRVGRYKPEHEDWTQYSEEMLHRCIEDTEILDLVFSKLVEEQTGTGWAQSHLNLNFKVFEHIHEMSEYGWLVDQEYMLRMINLTSHWIRKISDVLSQSLPFTYDSKDAKEQKKGKATYCKKPFKINGQYVSAVVKWMEANGYKGDEVVGPYSRLVFRRMNPLSADEMKTWLISMGWEPLEWNYKKGKDGWPVKVNGQKVKTSPVLNGKDPFKGVNGQLGRIASRMFQCKHRRSLVEGLIKLIRTDGRISQRILQVTTTYRMIHNGIVNIPGGKKFMGKHMRKMFISKQGFSIVGTDSAGCQNRMKAARVGDPSYTKTLLEGTKEDKTSIHHLNSANLLAAGLPVSLDDDARYSQAKNLDYGMAFGSMDKGLGAQLGGDAKLGAKIREVLLSVAPGLSKLVEDLANEWRSTAKKRKKWGRVEYYDGTVVGLDGRPVHIKNEKDVLVFFLQSDESIMMSKALCILFELCEEEGWVHGVDWGLCAWVHDEFQAEVRDDLITRYRKISEDSIRLAGEFYKISVPHEGESAVGHSWWETH